MQNKIDSLKKEIETKSAAINQRSMSPMEIATLGAMSAAYLALKDIDEESFGTKERPPRDLELIMDELQSAEEYVDFYKRTRERQFLDMAKDELRHGEFFMMKAKSNPDISPSKIKAFQAWHDAISESISM